MMDTEKQIEREVYCGILPAKAEDRRYGFFDAFMILSGYCVATWSYTQGAYLTGLVGFWQLLATAFFGALLMLLIYQLPVILSARFGIDIWIWLRTVFGTKGVKVLSVIIIIINFPWYAVCCDLFAGSMQNLAALFGCDLSAYKLPLELLCVGVGSVIALSGIREKASRVLVPLLLLVGIAVIYVGFSTVPVHDIISYIPENTAYTKSTAYILALEANFAFVITLVGGMAGIPRLCKSETGAYYAGVLGQGVSGSLFVAVGAVMAIATKVKTGISSVDPTFMLAKLASPTVALCSLLLVAFANIGTQAVGSYLYAVTLKSTFKKVSYRVLVLCLGIYVALLCVWGGIVEYFGSFLTVSALIYAPLAGLLFADFFLVRKQRIDLRAAYELEGHTAYVYTKGFNIVGLICLVFGVFVSLAVYDPISGNIHNRMLFTLTPTGLAFVATVLLYWLIGYIPPVRRYLKKDLKTVRPFDRAKYPPRQKIYMLPFVWIFSLFNTLECKLKIKRELNGIKPPFTVLATHQSFTDFPVTALALFPHRANYVSEIEGFEYYGEWLFRGLGCLGTRKFTRDPLLVKNIKRVLDRGDILVLYPEARYANVGTSSKLSPSVVKLVKLLKKPVVVLNMQGNYLRSPIWNTKKRKGVTLRASLKTVLTTEDLQNKDDENIYALLSQALKYDEYEYQRTNGIITDNKDRAEGLELPLYRCMHCGGEHTMKTSGAELKCTACNAVWTMDTDGTLTGDEKIYIPDWYEEERKVVKEEIKTGVYGLKAKVRIYDLRGSEGFIDMGNGFLTHDKSGFTLKGGDLLLKLSPSQTPSVHTEYNYRNMGQCITLSDEDNTYFLFPVSPKEDGFNATKIQFAAEELWENG